MVKRELQLSDGSSDKFWTISLKGNTHTVVYGRVGTTGRALTKSFDAKADAKASYEKLVQSKLKKGYVDTTTKAKSSSKKSNSTAKKKQVRDRTPLRTKGKSALSKKKRLERLVSRMDADLGDEGLYWLGACSEKRINKVEEILNVRFPKSYREFLALKGGGGIEAFYILGIPPKGPLEGGGACGYFAKHFKEDWVAEPLPEHLVPIQSDDDLLDPYCLDTSRLTRGECPVVHYFLANGIIEEIAPDFVSFYEEQLAPYFDRAGQQDQS